ncbi:cysteine desulfurase family protein [Streptococcus sciuri]|uniref:cysteine desulfurase n=1 Tax=Streptococcus sciuri TaxID=2973939 RepID=A0ABT2F5G4_9STRE|nr:cysteine desulfurase family protein [Streptococcus sciuri]MCS4487625.1 cysteine desulfurase [Streptococcus sciuri]
MTHSHIYLDNAATTAMTPSVIETMTKMMTTSFGNPSSTHSFGRQANQHLRAYRQVMAEALGVPAHDIIFTSGATESNNYAIKGYALANQVKGKHLITTEIEHHSVLHTMAYLEKRFGFEVTYLKPKEGQITAKMVKEALRDDTILVSIMYANNETGDLLPIAEIGEILKDHQAVFHVDAVQAFGKVALRPRELKIDFLSASAHKYHGPKGVGILFAKSHHMDNLFHGGEQEEKRRASTENMVGIAGMAQATSDALLHLEENYLKVEHLKKTFLTELGDVAYYINGSQKTMPYVLNIGFPKQSNHVLMTLLDLKGFAISIGSACTAGTIEPSHVLTSYYGANSKRLSESIRISFSDLNTPEEVTLLAQALKEIIGR